MKISLNYNNLNLLKTKKKIKLNMILSKISRPFNKLKKKIIT